MNAGTSLTSIDLIGLRSLTNSRYFIKWQQTSLLLGSSFRILIDNQMITLFEPQNYRSYLNCKLQINWPYADVICSW